MTAALIFVVALPVVLAASMVTAWGRSAAIRFAWLAPLPGLVLAVLPASDVTLPLDWLMLGGLVGLDTVGRTFLLLTALLWSAAGSYARYYLAGDPRQSRFTAFHLLTMAGNLGLAVAQDLAAFYAAFAVMTFGGYALVAHDPRVTAQRAARIYLVLAVVGESMLLGAFILAGSAAESLAFPDVARAVAESPQRDLLMALLLGGFGIKAGAVPLHVWLPLAHPVAPTPASAVLSGSMIKAGLLGWIRFLPLGIVSLEGWGIAILVAGLAAAFFGVAAGVTQRDAKTALAYSSISQMGFINAAIGVGLASADAWPLALAAVLTYAVHHGLAKGALFLSVGVVSAASGGRQRRVALAGVLFAALAVAGAPLTSGAVAKENLKALAPLAPVQWPLPFDLLLGMAALGSALLMARVLVILAGERQQEKPGASARQLMRSWGVLLFAVAITVWILPAHHDLAAYPPTLPGLADLWAPIWPVAGGALVAWIVLLMRRRGVLRRWPQVTPGDLLIPVERLLGRALAVAKTPTPPEAPTPVVSLSSLWYGIYARPEQVDIIAVAERWLLRWPIAGLLFGMLIIVLSIALVLS